MITDRQKANWAVAHARQTSRKRLTPALRAAYNDEPFGVPDGAAMQDALLYAQEIVAALEAGLELRSL